MKISLPRLVGLALGLAATAAVAAPPSGHPSPGAAMQMMQKEPVELTRSGKVVSHIDASEYTYVQVSEKGRNLWLAAPRTPLKDGDKVRFPDGVVMKDFYSKVLQRTFSSLMFVDSVEVAK